MFHPLLGNTSLEPLKVANTGYFGNEKLSIVARATAKPLNKVLTTLYALLPPPESITDAQTLSRFSYPLF